jgi:hypothetical protein
MSVDRPSEKPYDFAPLPFRAARDPIAGHHLFAPGTETGSLECQLVLLRPLQVAAGLLDFVRDRRGEEQMAALHAGVPRAGRRVYVVPGSSLKGVLRNLAEAVSFSCFGVAAPGVRGHIPEPLRRCTRLDRLCPACRLFGMTGARRESYMGSVHVTDAELPPDGKVAVVRTPLLWTPVRGQRLPNLYLRGRQLRGRKFYFHGQMAVGPDARVALQAGQSLHAAIYFDNLSPGLLGVLLAAMGLHPEHRFPIKMGGGKPVGMGSLEVRPVAAVLRGSVAAGGRLGAGERRLTGDELRRWVAERCRAAEEEELLYREGLERVAAILGPDGLDTRSMPSGPY